MRDSKKANYTANLRQCSCSQRQLQVFQNHLLRPQERSMLRSVHLQNDQLLSLELLRQMQGKIDPFSRVFKCSSKL
ncbi:hypothetical protein Nmel_006734 [Mimus melanotis]